MSTGWTWDYVLAEVDLPRLGALRKYWKDLPPVHLMLAARYGVLEKKEEEKVQSPEELMRMFGQGPVDWIAAEPTE